ncbi:MAG: hypothetical protein AAF226_02190 [Verrucomicrobiota bacterium]
MPSFAEEIICGTVGPVVQVGAGTFRRTERGFHTGRVKYLVQGDPENYFQRGSLHPKASSDNTYARMYVADSSWTESGALWEVDVSFKGFFGNNGPNSTGYFSRSVRTQAGSFSGENVTSPAGSGKHVVGDPSISVAVSYLQFTEPDTSLVNTVLTPPDAPPVPPNYWASAPDIIFNWPYGWSLDGRDVDDIRDESGAALVYFVNDTYIHRHRWRAGDV